MIHSLGGSRKLSTNWAQKIYETVTATPPPDKISVGCCVGADEILIQLATYGDIPIGKLQVFCSFGQGGMEAINGLSAWASVEKFESLGGQVFYTPDRDLNLPPPVRLRNRTIRVIKSGNGKFFLFPGPTMGKGAKLVLDECRSRPIIIFKPGCNAQTINPVQPCLF